MFGDSVLFTYNNYLNDTLDISIELKNISEINKRRLPYETVSWNKKQQLAFKHLVRIFPYIFFGISALKGCACVTNSINTEVSQTLEVCSVIAGECMRCNVKDDLSKTCIQTI